MVVVVEVCVGELLSLFVFEYVECYVGFEVEFFYVVYYFG